MRGDTKTSLYELTYEVSTYGQNKKVWLRWYIPRFTNLLTNHDGEIRTNRNTDFEQEFDEDSKFQLRLKFLGTKGEMVQLHYLAPRPVFLKIDLDNYKEPKISKDYHWVPANKWQFLFEENTELVKTNSYDDNMRIQLIFLINMKSDNDTEKDNIIPETGLIQDIGNLFNNSMLSDILIKSNDGVQFHAHKLILAIRSEVLKAHFDHNTVESISNIIESPFESEVLQPLLMYMYSDNVPQVYDMPEKLLKAADFYQLHGLKYICEKVLQEQLTIDNVIETMKLAHTYIAENLKRFCLEFISDGNAKALIETKSWEEAPLELTKIIAVHIIKNNK